MTEMNYLDLHGERIAYRDAGAGKFGSEPGSGIELPDLR